ncbi:MAG: precorrin-4 C(11)-methyltransferase [Elainellaceae cyanobacterium]
MSLSSSPDRVQDLSASPMTDETDMIPAPVPPTATVYIVGAGPGDPEMLTIKAKRLIETADVVLYANSLVPQQILDMADSDAELIATANKTLEEILPLMVERVKAHKTVVRLHSGDPSLYGAVYEQMQFLANAQIPFEIVPGISAFQAAAARLNVELTVPGLVQTIILTRVSGRTQVPEPEELVGLAAHQASLCLYLSARHVDNSQAKLLQHYPADTPVAVCFRLGWPDEQIWVVPLSDMSAVTKEQKLERTTLYLISPALKTAHPLPDPRIEIQAGVLQVSNDGESSGGAESSEDNQRRSRLYNPEHHHLFRPNKKESRSS